MIIFLVLSNGTMKYMFVLSSSSSSMALTCHGPVVRDLAKNTLCGVVQQCFGPELSEEDVAGYLLRRLDGEFDLDSGDIAVVWTGA